MAAADSAPFDTAYVDRFQAGLEILANAIFGPTRNRAARAGLVQFLVASVPTSGAGNAPDPAAAPIHGRSRTIHIDDFYHWFRRCMPARLLLDGSLSGLYCEKALPSTLLNTRDSLLEEEHVFCLQAWLPEVYRRKWKLQFSSSQHGESFSALRGTLLRSGATIIVIGDQEGHVFGSFTRDEWSLNPNFYGHQPCFLFSLVPSLAVYFPTQQNQNFQYLSSGLATSLTGLGLGGQKGYHGIWLDGNFGEGHLGRGIPQCSTFGNPQLSKSEIFKIGRVEVWEVAPRSDAVPQKSKSVLDCNLEDQELLEMAGRPMVSRDIRPANDPSY